MKEKNIIDQSVLAEDVANKIHYEFMDYFLVKPLDPIKVTKEFTKPVSEKEATTDKNGVEAVDFDKTETEVKEVDSDFRKGVVLKIPTSYARAMSDTAHPLNAPKINVGDVILFRERSAMFFDLIKDSMMVRYYDIVAIEK